VFLVKSILKQYRNEHQYLHNLDSNLS